MESSSPSTQTASPPPSDEATAPVQLSGWRLWAAWAVLALIAVWGVILHIQAAPVFAEVVLVADPAFDRVHLAASRTPGIPVTPLLGGVAEAAGLPAGRLVAVDGQPLSETATLLDAGRLVRGAVGTPVRLSVAMAAGDTVMATVRRAEALSTGILGGRVPAAAIRWIGVGAQSLANLVGLGVALLLLVRRRRSLIALVAAGLFLMQATWSAVTGTAFEIFYDDSLLGLEGITTLFVATIIAFLALFPDGRFRPRWAVALVVLALAKNAIEPVFSTLEGRQLFSVSVLLPLMLLGLVAQGIRYRRFATEDQRLQTKWALLGIVAGTVSVVIGIVVEYAVPVEAGSSAYWWRQIALTVFFSGFVLVSIGVAVSLLKYRLWDAEAAWSRSAMAAALTLALTAIVAGGTALTQAAFGASGPLALALATAAAAALFVPLQRRLSDWADHRFLRDLTDLKERLPQLVGHLRETESVEGIAEAVVDRVLPAVHATHVALVVPEGEGWTAAGFEGIDASSTEAWAEGSKLATPPELTATRRHPWRAVVWRQPEDRLFPVRVALRAERGGGELATEGWLLLGPRPDGSGYGPDDLEAVAEIAGPVGRALRVVNVRDIRRAEMVARWESREAERDARLDERLGRIEALLSP